MHTLTLTVTGMTCGGCENSVKRSLARLDGVGEVDASHADSRVVVRHDPARVTPAQIRDRIVACGFTVAD
jgi:copper chaperone CopZ